MFDTIWQDVRHAIRGLRRSPAFGASVVLTLALGTGVNVAIFSVVDHVLRRPLPVADPDELVNLSSPGPKAGSTSSNSGFGGSPEVFSYPLFRDLERVQTVFTGLAAQRDFEASVAVSGRAAHVTGLLVSGSYFPTLGLQPALGRLFTREDDRVPGSHPLVVLSHDYWRAQFAGNPAVLNEALTVNGQRMTIVGVAPSSFISTTLDDAPQIYVPLGMAGSMRPGSDAIENRRSHWLYLFARLRPGHTREDAERAINVPFAGLIEQVELPAQRSGLDETERAAFARRQLLLTPGAQGQRPDRERLARLAVLLFCVTGIVLLMACANVVNLLLARSLYRRPELTLRMSVGAGRGRLIRHLLIESAVIALAGGAAGLLLAGWMLGVLTPLLPGAVTFRFMLDRPVFLFTTAVVSASVLLIGLYPALYGTRGELAAALRGGIASAASAPASRFRTALTALQVALSLTLLVLAGLFAKSLLNVSRVELGIQPENLITFRIRPELSGYTRPRARLLVERIEQEIAALAGVRTVGVSTIPLLDNVGSSGNVTLEHSPRDQSVSTADVGPGYFRAVGIPLVAGREFTRSDVVVAPKVAIVNEAFVRAFGLGRDVIGRRMGLGAGRVALDIEIVGLVRDARYSDVKAPPPPQLYLAYRQGQRFEAVNFYIRSSGASGPLPATIERLMTAIDATVPIENLRLMSEQVRVSTESDRSLATVAAAFAVLAMLLAAVGLYGVLSYGVAQRRREISVRMAVGATPWRITRLIVGSVARMTIAGAIMGTLAALGLGRLAQSLLFGVSAADPQVLTAAVVIVTAVAFAAATIPAGRAARVEPMAALRAG